MTAMTANPTILQRDHHTVTGRIAYTSNKPDRAGQERGRESFRIDRHGDGTRTCTAHCEIDDRPSVMRDIVYSLDAAWMPTDCFVRLSVDDRFTGSGWFRFAAGHAECETWTATEGRISQRMELQQPLQSFQNHSIACDAWHLRLFELVPGQVQVLERLLLSSPDHRGATGPMLFSVSIHVEFVGPDTVTVGAGTFEALHFRFVGAPGLPVDHPVYDVWCTADGEFLFLCGEVGGYMQTRYELVELQRG
jgi:hypothetical protein